MPTLEEILADKSLPDTTPITMGEHQIPLGSLRQASSKQLEAISERVKQLDGREGEITRRQKEIVDLATQAQQAYARAQEALKTAETRNVAPGADPFTDPWLAPVKSELEKRDKTVAQLQASLDNATKLLQNAAVAWAEDRWDNEYDRIDFGKRTKVSREDMLKYANENKLLDRRNLPSISKAWEQMTAAERRAEQEDKVRQEGIEEGERRAMAARVSPPGVPGAAPIPKAGNGKASGDLGDLYSQAMEDAELRALLEQLPAGTV